MSRSSGLFLLCISGSGDLQTNIIEQFFLLRKLFTSTFFSLLRRGLFFCICLVKLTPVVVNQGSVIPPILSELPAKIHSMEGLPVFPLHFAEEK